MPVGNSKVKLIRQGYFPVGNNFRRNGCSNPSGTQELSRSPLVAAGEVLLDGKCVISGRARSSAAGFFWSSWHTEFSLLSCVGKLSGTVRKPCLVTFLEISSCLCMNESTPHLSPTPVRQAVSTRFACLQRCCHSSIPSPSGCPNFLVLCQTAARSHFSRSSRMS